MRWRFQPERLHKLRIGTPPEGVRGKGYEVGGRQDLVVVDGFTALAIGSLAIGNGATSAMFGFAESILLRPLPVLRPNSVVAINTATSGAGKARAA
jgi:hypothetical protein